MASAIILTVSHQAVYLLFYCAWAVLPFVLQYTKACACDLNYNNGINQTDLSHSSLQPSEHLAR